MEIAYRLTRPLALDVTLDIRGLTVLLGASGAGKTSLLRAIAGLIPASGSPFGNLPVQSRRIGYLPQHYALFPHLSALGNVAFPLYSYRRAERERRAAELLASLGVAHCAARRPHALSGGEQQRVALARALAREPRLLLLDEPLSAVDAPTAAEIVGWLSRTIAEIGIPTLAATHDPMVAAAAERIAILDGGRIIQQGDRAAVLDAPVSVAAARLLGFSNLLPASAQSAGGHPRITCPLGDLPLPPGSVAAESARMTLAFRAERAWVVAAGAPAPDGSRVALRAAATLESFTPPIGMVRAGNLRMTALLAPDMLRRTGERDMRVDLLIPETAVRLLPGAPE